VSVGRHRRDEDAEFRLLFVCTGNICRSAFAEVLTRHLLNERLGYGPASGFAVSSAGVQAVIGSGMHPWTRELLRPWGGDALSATDVVARQLDPSMVEQSHLVLGAARRHRAAAVQAAPAALTTAFSLREFARLVPLVDLSTLADDPVQRAHALVHEVRSRRGLVPPVDPEDDEVLDPMGRPREAHRAATRLISEAVLTLIDALAPPSRPDIASSDGINFMDSAHDPPSKRTQQPGLQPG
jgi:protein-tyrosine phosphatase